MAFTIRPTIQDNEILDRLKNQLNENMSSKALLRAASIVVFEIPEIKDELKEVRQKADDLEYKYTLLRSTLKAWAEAESQLNEHLKKEE